LRASEATRDREHRDLASGLDGGLDLTCLVEAGAGTGKTTVLIDRLLSLVRAGTSVSRIVAITFTEKAAGELRVRFREGLEASLEEASDEERPTLEQALRELDRANIGTIHSFCSGLLRERPVEARVDPDFVVADELRQSVLLESAWDGWVRGELAVGLPTAVAEAHALGVGLQRIRELAFTLIREPDAGELFPQAVEDDPGPALASALREEAKAFLETARDACSDTDDLAYESIRAFAEDAQALESVPEESALAFAMNGVKVGPASNRGKKGNWKGDSLAELRDRASALRDMQDEARRVASHNAAVGLFSWLEGFFEAYEREKRAAGYLDFQDLLSRARDLLKTDLRTRAYFKRSYDRVLVDEFQDTDPLQCEIVFFLSEEREGRAGEWRDVRIEPGKLFLVGDPKQSIYRFRRADIEMYEEAKSLVAAQGRVLELSENFRTRPAVIESVNRTFRDVMVAPDGDRRYQPDYEPLNAHRPEDDAGPGVVLLRPGDATEEKTKAADVRQEEATAVAAYVRGLLDEGRPTVFDRETGSWRAPGLGDIAILFHKSTGLTHYEDALNAYGLDYRIAGGKRFYIRREVTELCTVLSAIDDPNDLVSVLGALRTPFFGVSDEDIVVHRHRTGGLRYLSRSDEGVESVEQAFELLRRLHLERNSHNVSELIMRLFDVTSALELYLLKPTGEQRHANLLKVVELAASLEKQEPMSFGGFVRWLRDVSRLTPEEAESPLSEEGEQFVRVLTIHKAKGLEFPVVILADLGRNREMPEDLIIDREERRLDYSKGGKGARLRTIGYEDAHEFEGLRATAETIRLLYVGSTRARDLLVVPWYADDRKPASGLLEHMTGLTESAPGAVEGASDGAAVARDSDERPDGGTRGARHARDALMVSVADTSLDLSVERARPVRLHPGEATETDPSETESALALAEWKEKLRVFATSHDRPPAVVRPSSLGHSRTPPMDESERDTLSRGDGTELGVLVHAVMEKAALGATGGIPGLVRALARGQAAPAERVERAERMAAAAMRSDVVRRAVSSGAYEREVPFCVRRDGLTLEGKIDLLFVEDGRLSIVDYKTDRRPEGGFDGLVERYRGQALAYSVAAESATGLQVADVTLLFVSGDEPEERVVPLDGDLGRRWEELESLTREGA